jgi:hypothetical protein
MNLSPAAALMAEKHPSREDRDNRKLGNFREIGGKLGLDGSKMERSSRVSVRGGEPKRKERPSRKVRQIVRVEYGVRKDDRWMQRGDETSTGQKGCYRMER